MASMNPSPTPAAPPPPGVIPNFIHPLTFENTILGFAIFIILLTVFFVVIRLYSNYHAVRGLGWDDWFCVAATLLLLVYIGIGLSLRKYARHIWDIDSKKITAREYKKLLVSSVLEGPTLFLAKNSIFFLYYRIFSPKKLVKYLIIIGIVFSFAVGSARTVIDAYYCAPHVGKQWSKEVGFSCAKSNVVGMIQGVANLVLNLFIFSLPIPVILQLQLPRKKKFAVLAIFLTAIFAIIASTIGMVYRVSLWKHKDPTWNGFIVQMCEFIEGGVTIMCGSMPALATFSKTWLAKSAYLASFPSRRRSRPSVSNPNPKSPFRMFSTIRTSSSHFVDSTTLRLADDRGLGAFPDSNTKTVSYSAPSEDDVEMGVIKKSIKMEQTSS